MSEMEIEAWRQRTATETVSKFESIAPAVGLTRLASITGLDRLGLPVAAAFRPNARSVSVNHGKGMSESAAKASAAGEAIELYHAETIDSEVQINTYDEIRRDMSTVDPALLPLAYGVEFDPNYPIPWLHGRTLDDEHTIMVPMECVSLDLTDNGSGNGDFFHRSSSGLGAGNTFAEAILHGLCELIERDAHTNWMMSGPRFKASTRIDVSRIRSPICRQLLVTCEEKGLLIGAWEITSDVGVPAILIALVERDKQAPNFVPFALGTGCHPVPGIAAFKAITEAVQMRLMQITTVRDDLEDKDYSFSNEAIWQSKRDVILEQTSAKIWNEDSVALSQEEGLHDILRNLHDRGVGEPVLINLTKQDLGVPVVKIIVPGLEDAIDGLIQRIGDRATRALVDVE